MLTKDIIKKFRKDVIIKYKAINVAIEDAAVATSSNVIPLTDSIAIKIGIVNLHTVNSELLALASLTDEVIVSEGVEELIDFAEYLYSTILKGIEELNSINDELNS